MKKVSNLQYMLWMMMMMIIFIFSPQNSKIRICMDMYALCWIYRVYHLMVFYNFPNNSHLTRLSNHIWLMKWVRSTKGDSPKKKPRSYHQNSIVLKSINDPIDTVHQQIISKFINFFFFFFLFPFCAQKSHASLWGGERNIVKNDQHTQFIPFNLSISFSLHLRAYTNSDEKEIDFGKRNILNCEQFLSRSSFRLYFFFSFLLFHPSRNGIWNLSKINHT